MAEIKIISGKVLTTSPSISLKADEKYLFEVVGWSTTITSPKKVTWRLMDTAKKNELKVIKENVLAEEFISITINKKYSGYPYYLEAALEGTTEKTGVFISGYTDKKIISSAWSKTKGGTSIKNKSAANPVTYGESVFLHLETEGLNGQKVTIEIYNEETGLDNIVRTYTGATVRNGEVNLKIKDSYLWRAEIDWWVDDIEQFYIKVKNSGSYVKDNLGDKLHAIYLNIEDKITSKKVDVPENLTPLKVSQPAVSILPMGIIELIKVEVVTDFAICNDFYTDKKDLWLLEDSGNTKYHWLKNSLRIKSKNNEKRPTIIPIIVMNDKNFEMRVTFNTIIPTDNIKIRVRDKQGNYLFSKGKPHIKRSKNEEFTIPFESTNTPFTKTIQYIPTFKLTLEYSFDDKIWFPLSDVPLRLYVPWKDPSMVYSKMDSSVQKTIGGKKLIRETLIWLGCEYAEKMGNDTSLTSDKNEEAILDAVFKPFKSLKIFRKREGGKRLDGTDYLSKNFPTEGMGYWRGESLPSTTTGTFDAARTARTSFSFLLSEGEARCGEWTTFFQNILLALGIDVSSDTIGICTRIYASHFGYGDTSTGFKLTDASHNFAVKNAIHNDTTDSDSTTGDSPGQGTGKSRPIFVDHFWFYYIKQGRFFDASYGKSYNKSDSNLKKYCSDNINSVFVEGVNITSTPPALTGSKRIEKSKLHDFIVSDRALF